MLKRHRKSSSTSAAPLSPRQVDGSESIVTKIAHLGEGEEIKTSIYCGLPPHELIAFADYIDYEIHYQQVHVNRCLECHRNFPTEHFLSLHIAERHDPINESRRDRGDKTFACFVEDCDKVCSTPQKRRMHLIDKHMFPRNYDFFIVNDGMDGRTSMLRIDNGDHRHDSESGPAAHAESSSIRKPLKGNDTSLDRSRSTIDEISGAMSSLNLVPPSIRFGRQKGGSGFARS